MDLGFCLIPCTSIGQIDWFLFELWSRGMFCGWADTQENIPPTPSDRWLWQVLLGTGFVPVIKFVGIIIVSTLSVNQ